MLALQRAAKRLADAQASAASGKRARTSDDGASTGGGSSSVFDEQTERSMRDRSVTSQHERRRADSTSHEALQLSATNSEQRANGVVRSEVSSIHIEDEPPPPRPAPPPTPVVAGCPVCREQYHSLFEENRSVGEATDARAGGVKTTARNAKARSAIQQALSNRYVMIFRAESILRGVVGDEQLMQLMLQMHQRLIESKLRERPEIVFTPWTIEMLRVHYNPLNRHFFDKIRSISSELARADRMLALVESQTMVPDPNNPGTLMLDARAVAVLERMSAHKVKLVQTLDKMNREKEEDLAAAVFTFVSAIDRMTRDTSSINVLRDPRTAAGTVAVGGDALRTANVGSANAIGSAYDFYAMSGY